MTVTAEHGEAEIAEDAVEEPEQVEHRLGDEVEPAPVDQQFEPVELVVPSRRPR